MQSYKFVYLGNYVINLIIVGGLLILYWSGMGTPGIVHTLQMGICCMGLFMVLNLWSRSFVANDAYQGKRLDTRTIRSLTCALAVIEGMTLYSYVFGNNVLIKPATACLLLWMVASAYLFVSGRILRQPSLE